VNGYSQADASQIEQLRSGCLVTSAGAGGFAWFACAIPICLGVDRIGRHPCQPSREDMAGLTQAWAAGKAERMLPLAHIICLMPGPSYCENGGARNRPAAIAFLHLNRLNQTVSYHLYTIPRGRKPLRRGSKQGSPPR
jgi:hypothetical protein